MLIISRFRVLNASPVIFRFMRVSSICRWRVHFFTVSDFERVPGDFSVNKVCQHISVACSFYFTVPDFERIPGDFSVHEGYQDTSVAC